MTQAIARVLFERCPLCESPRFAFLREASCVHHPLYDARLPATIRWMRCEACAHVFTDGWFDEAAERVLFQRSLPNQTPSWSFDHGQRLLSARMVGRVTALRPMLSGRWLDVGFGNGSLLAVAEEHGFEVTGLDARSGPVDALRAMGFRAHQRSLVDLEDAPFDVISMADVLEHIPFPRPTLDAARRLLAPGGLLFVSMPNMDSFDWRSRDHLNQNPYWGELEHLHNFGRKRLYALLAEHRFAPRSYGVNERYFTGMEVLAEKLP